MRDRALPLPRVLAPFVTERTRAKGQAYYLRGAVTSIDTTGSYLSATVRGTRAYQVTIFPNEGGFTASCDCPFFSEHHDICKHIWATILAADQGGMLASYGAETWLDVAGERASPGAARTQTIPDQWQRFLGGVLQQVAAGEAGPTAPRFINGQITYALDRTQALQGQGVALTVLWRQRKKNGEWGKAQPLAVTQREIEQLPDPMDREILALLVGAVDEHPGDTYTPIQSRASFRLSGPLTDRALWMLASSGRLSLRTGPQHGDDMTPVRADHGPPWAFRFEVTDTGDGSVQLFGFLERGDERLEVTEPQLVLASGHLIVRGTLARLNHGDAFTWLAELRRTGPATFPTGAAPALIEALVRSRVDPSILPSTLRYDVVETAPRPRLRVARDTRPAQARPGDLEAAVTFEYDGVIVAADAGSTAYDAERRRMIKRQTQEEQRHLQRLHDLGFRRGWDQAGYTTHLLVSTEQFDRAVRALVSDGWRVEADGAVFRAAHTMKMQVSSGIDWFELHGEVDFGDGVSVPLTKLLASLKRGDRSILLGDGTRGMVPDEWLRRYARIAGFGQVEGDHVRYRPSQTALLDALLESQPSVSIDETFARARAAMPSFAGIQHVQPPASFKGQLRDYQMEALGWFDFLRRFGFGGCLADDMGLGKTVMVLALLEAQRLQPAPERRPSLVVVPRSLVFNWIAEAQRFAPGIRVLDYTGPQRVNARLEDHDLVLTTYGTLRRDAAALRDYEFDYVILDEAQAIKNAVTATAKAVRLLRGRHRLALSGTPVENHIGELWSLFEFLNPGLLGSSGGFARASEVQRRDGGEDLALVARALKPLILRRTKAQVAPELPERTEQTIYCDLDAAQRTFYDDLRAHYRSTLFTRVERDGLNRSTIHVLEALLRLRQAACHAGLVDATRAASPSAKFDLLVPRLAEIVEEGHKALVFSQFTQLLGLLKPRLDAAGIVYEYLDGQTRDRGARVDRFSTDPACGVFLISLKAGGLGLNLTAAEYVFLLDPWWNPAAEAQAIDRAHRIGQSQHVFAYRLIARDTVEEKVAQLQASKRELVDAILTADPALLRNLKPEDLDLLLS
ncbi:MAG TPA: DEAD/DEAH box helicase [Vicinamibacterales bacterium]|nr:DEAD/DEAH box helicase [Vicinamibacterales bacterium]